MVSISSHNSQHKQISHSLINTISPLGTRLPNFIPVIPGHYHIVGHLICRLLFLISLIRMFYLMLLLVYVTYTFKNKMPSAVLNEIYKLSFAE